MKKLLELLSKKTKNNTEDFILRIPLKEGSTTEIDSIDIQYASKDSKDEYLMNNVLGKALIAMMSNEPDLYQSYVAYFSMIEGKSDKEIAEINERLGEQTGEWGQDGDGGYPKVH